MRKGFTLVEMLVVILILSVTAGVAATVFLGMFTPDESARDLERCRREAILMGEAQRSWIDSVRVSCLPDGQVVGIGAGQLTGRLR